MTSGFELNQKFWILVHVQLWGLANPKKKVKQGSNITYVDHQRASDSCF